MKKPVADDQRVKWPWLGRLAVVLQVVAYIDLLLGVVGALLTVASTKVSPEAGVQWLDFGRFVGILVAAAISFVVLMGASEAARILLRLDARAT